MSQLEQEAKYNIERGGDLFKQTKRQLDQGLQSLGSLVGVWPDQPGWEVIVDPHNASKVIGWRKSWDPRRGARPGLISKARAWFRK